MTKWTKETILAEGVARIKKFVENYEGMYGPVKEVVTITPSEVADGDAVLRLNFGRYGDVIADQLKQEQYPHPVNYCTGDRQSWSYWQVVPR